MSTLTQGRTPAPSTPDDAPSARPTPQTHTVPSHAHAGDGAVSVVNAPDASVPPVKKREIFGWAMFDFANSSYTTVVITVVFSGFFTQYIIPAESKARDSYWSLAILLSTLLSLVLSPLAGAICDYSGRKKRYLFASALVCAVSTCALFFVEPGAVWLGVAIVAISNAAFMLSETFCGSFLTELATRDTMAKISGLGWGLGYFGGLASLLLVLEVAKTPEGAPLADIVAHNQRAMVATGVFFLLAALPTLLLVRNRARPAPGFENAGYGQLLRAGWQELKQALDTARQYKILFRFLLAFMVYMAGLDAVIKFVGIYARAELGFQTAELTIMFLIIQLSAAGGALGFGLLEGRLGPKKTVLLTLAWWVVGIFGIFFLDALAGALSMEPKKVFYAVSLMAGAGIGATQSSSRAVVGLLAPAHKSAQMFGFWGMFMRLSTVLGVSFGVVSDALDSRRMALLLVVGFFVVGGWMLWRIPIDEGIAQARRDGTAS